MSSKTQKIKFLFVCQCGCGEIFTPFPVYNKNTVGWKFGKLIYPMYKVGHNPACKKGYTPWNKGLKKGDHPSIDRMGYQPGHKPYNNWDHVNKALKEDPELRERWLKAKRGQIPWNKGIKRKGYPNGIASGSEHGNWCGGKRGAHDTAEMKRVKLAVYKRDNYTCQECGDRNHKGRGSRIRLEAHHIVSIAEDESLAYTHSNIVTLCHACHVKTDNYGTKVVHKIRKQRGN